MAATVTSATATTIVATVPTGASSGPISVTSPNGSATSSSSFTVAASKAPTIASFCPLIGTAGDAVGISGTNFDSLPTNDIVDFNGTRAQVTAATATSLSTIVPPGTSGRISVATSNGRATSTADFFITPPPYHATDVDFKARTQIGGTQAVTISTAGHIAMVIFDGTENQKVSLSLSMSIGSGSCCTTLVSILSPDGTYLASPTWAGPTTGFVDAVTLPVTGTYTIIVDPDQSYTASATLTLNDAHDVTGTLTPSPSGGQATPTTTTPGQNASYTFTGSVSQRISLNVTNVTMGSNIPAGVKLSIKNPDGTWLVAPYEFGNSGTYVDLQVLSQAGTYTITVDPIGANVGSATLTLYQVPADVRHPGV